MQEFVQIMVSGPGEDLRKIAKNLVESRLAACVQISGPVYSTFRWKDKIEEEEEMSCLIKTTMLLYPRVEEEIRRSHSYEVPEILVFPVLAGNPDYLEWIRSEVNQS